jgi:hypothetical protein
MGKHNDAEVREEAKRFLERLNNPITILETIQAAKEFVTAHINELPPKLAERKSE